MYTFNLEGIAAEPVEVKARLNEKRGEHWLTVAGRDEADRSVKEIGVRVRASLRRLSMPDIARTAIFTRRVEITFGKEDVDLRGGRHDLAVAVAVLELFGEVPRVGEVAFAGELDLGGAVRPVRGVLPCVLSLPDEVDIVVPVDCGREAAGYRGGVRAAGSLADVVAWLRACLPVPEAPASVPPDPNPNDAYDEVRRHFPANTRPSWPCLILRRSRAVGDVARVVQRMSQMYSIDLAERVEVTKIYSVAGLLNGDRGLVERPPFRAPHHTCSLTAMVGGGSPSRPGEVSLAHRGLLLLDEAHEFRPEVLRTLALVLANRKSVLSRRAGTTDSAKTIIFPANPRQVVMTCWTEEQADRLRETFSALLPHDVLFDGVVHEVTCDLDEDCSCGGKT